MKSNRLTTVALAAVILVAASACGTSGSDDGAAADPPGASVSPEWAATIAAAKKEGTVVVSGFPSSSDTNDKLAAQFQKEYGIKVQQVPLTSEFSAKYQTELAAGKVSMDLRSSGSSECASLESKGFTQSFGKLPIESEPASTWLHDPFEFAKAGHPGVLFNQVSGYFIVVNAKQFPEGSGPKGYKDLADPQYKGKLLIDKPGPVGFGTVWASTAWAAPGYGETYVKDVLANAAAVSSNAADELNGVATGRYGILVHAISSGVASLAGIPNSPVRLVVPDDGMMVSVGAVCFLKDAPHPNAAKLYLNFINGKSAQKFYGEAPGGSFIRAEVKASKPEFAPFAAAGAKFFPGSPLGYEAYAGANPTYFKYGASAGALLAQFGLAG